ncbi:uncharacterized protein LOC121740236 [Aricia agestis]|uniref:uncharacterized protein LOC121740236 n=1 Tax=Aricia agestis TaxID=91739 RepID=UPI001C2022E3|nr:uncharacterized protein LOC121740236 [Aricia agestis]
MRLLSFTMIALKFALSLLLVAFSVYGDESDEATACVALLENFGERCCESVATSQSFGADMTSCLADDSEEVTCDNVKCILTKQGIMKGDNIDEDAARRRFQQISKDNGGEREMAERIMRECLDGKFLEYPPEDACPAVKLFTCAFLNAQLSCTKWKSTDKCNQLAENAKKCKELVDEY